MHRVRVCVTHLFDDPHVAPYWPTRPCFLISYSSHTSLTILLSHCMIVDSGVSVIWQYPRPPVPHGKKIGKKWGSILAVPSAVPLPSLWGTILAVPPSIWQYPML